MRRMIPALIRPLMAIRFPRHQRRQPATHGSGSVSYSAETALNAKLHLVVLLAKRGSRRYQWRFQPA
jgi:hypothetical protein